MDANKIDVDALFKQYTIKEIQAIELQVKNEIEKKKEDLRIMVYNRYRDIIDAADGIHIMKSCSKQIETVLGDLQSTCDNVFNNKENSTIKQDKLRSDEKSKRNNKYVLAVIIKILQNSPSKIWYHLDNDEYIKAAKQYLLAQHAHICLELETNLKNLENSSSYIQYANELWDSIVFLSKTIASKSRDTFTDLNIGSSKTLIDAMSAIYLLENYSLEKLFREFIEKRTPMIKSVIDIDTKEQSSSSSIKDRVLKCLKSFVHTINHIYNLFSSDAENQLQSFEQSINESTFIIESLKDDGFVITKIPNYLKNVKFKNTNGMKRFEETYLNDRANLWLTSCLKDLQLTFANTFKYVSSLKSLVEIRDVVIAFESEIEDKSLSANDCGWTHVCQALFKKEIHVWLELIAPYYYTQSKAIIESSFKSTNLNLVSNLEDYLTDKKFDSTEADSGYPEMDINSYIWSMESSQFTGLNSSKNNKNSIDFISSKPSIQSRTVSSTSNQHIITPAVKQLCERLDSDLERLLNDIEFTTRIPDKNSSKPNLKNVISTDFEQFNEYLETNLKVFSEELCQSLSNMIEKKKIDEAPAGIKKILLICRFANALINQTCPQLKTCFNQISQQVVKQRKSQLLAKISDTNDVMQILSAAKRKSILTEQKSIDQNWLKLTDELQEICKAGFKIWIENVCSEIKQSYLENKFTKSPQPALAMNELIAWDEIEIEDELNSDPVEETEEQEKTKDKPETETLKSKLYAPLVSSPLIQTILYTLCQELTTNLSYNMIDSNLVLKDLILKVFELIINFYNKIVLGQNSGEHHGIKLTQNQSLQMLFDLRFLYNLFDIKSMSLNDKNSPGSVLNRIQLDYKNVSNELEALIDPFDYDICSPFIQSNITKSIARSNALYGVLSTNERIIRTNTSGSSLTTANDKFNLLVLSNNPNRFELLPLPSQLAQQQLSLEKQQNLLLKNQAALTKLDKATKNSSTSKNLTDSVNSASAGLSNVFKWFQ